MTATTSTPPARWACPLCKFRLVDFTASLTAEDILTKHDTGMGKPYCGGTPKIKPPAPTENDGHPSGQYP